MKFAAFFGFVLVVAVNGLQNVDSEAELAMVRLVRQLSSAYAQTMANVAKAADQVVGRSDVIIIRELQENVDQFQRSVETAADQVLTVVGNRQIPNGLPPFSQFRDFLELWSRQVSRLATQFQRTLNGVPTKYYSVDGRQDPGSGIGLPFDPMLPFQAFAELVGSMMRTIQEQIALVTSSLTRMIPLPGGSVGGGLTLAAGTDEKNVGQQQQPTQEELTVFQDLAMAFEGFQAQFVGFLRDLSRTIVGVPQPAEPKKNEFRLRFLRK